MSELANALSSLGFINVTGWIEKVGGNEFRVAVVSEDKRSAWNFNNGMLAVVDDNGHTWVIPHNLAPDGFFDLMLKRKLRLKAKVGYVPFSNDGGTFSRTVWPR